MERVVAITSKDVRNIANLARLHVEEDELVKYEQDLSNILAFVEQIEQADVNAIEPMAHPQDMAQRLRVDKATEVNQRDKFQGIAPATQDGLYLVPKVID